MSEKEARTSRRGQVENEPLGEGWLDDCVGGRDHDKWCTVMPVNIGGHKAGGG
jgi:hypothetical protein